MKDYRISDLVISETYNGVLAYENIYELNKRRIKVPKSIIEKYYGDDRPTWEEIDEIDMFEHIPKYYFIAWTNKDNTLKTVDKDGNIYFGQHLFIVGYIETMEEVFTAIDSLVKKRFEKYAQYYSI